MLATANQTFSNLTLSWRRLISYRNQSIDYRPPSWKSYRKSWSASFFVSLMRLTIANFFLFSSAIWKCWLRKSFPLFIWFNLFFYFLPQHFYTLMIPVYCIFSLNINFMLSFTFINYMIIYNVLCYYLFFLRFCVIISFLILGPLSISFLTILQYESMFENYLKDMIIQITM